MTMHNRKVSCLFPNKLHELLEDASVEGFESIVSWIPSSEEDDIHDDLHLKALPSSSGDTEADAMAAIQSGLITPFRVHKPREFETQIMPRYVQISLFYSD